MNPSRARKQAATQLGVLSDGPSQPGNWVVAPLLSRLGFTIHHSLLTTHRPEGTRRFNSSNQFSTTLICVGAPASCPPADLIITNRWPSAATA